MNANTLVIVENLHKSYYLGKSQVDVLKGISLKIDQGEVIAIVGPSGVGKSTLLHILGALDRPTDGKVEINNVDIFKYSDAELAHFRNLSIGFVFQFHHLLPEFTALENVMIPAMISKKNGVNIKNQAMQLLKEVGLADRLHHRPSELSGGEQQRVAVARALINAPRLVLADEPSGNLDLESSQALHRLFLELNNKLNQTIIIVTHNMDLAKKADRIIELFDGKIKSKS